MAEQAKTASKTTARRKPATRKPAKRKPATAKKTAARKPAAKRTTKKSAAASKVEFSARAQEIGRNAFLASLGFYGKAFDQAQEQLDSIQSQLEARRKKADKTYKELVKRGKKVEKNAKTALDDMELPKLESLTDRKQREAQLKKVKARFEDLRETVGLKAA